MAGSLPRSFAGGRTPSGALTAVPHQARRRCNAQPPKAASASSETGEPDPVAPPNRPHRAGVVKRPGCAASGVRGWRAGRLRSGEQLRRPRAVWEEISVEARHLVVDDPPAVGVLADDHTEVHGEGGAVAEAEVDSEVAEHPTIAQGAGFAERV